GVFLPRRAIDQQPRSIKLGCHIRELDLSRLILANRFAELDSILCVIDRFIKRAPCESRSRGADSRAKGVERGHCDTKPLAFFAEQIRNRNPATVETNAPDRMRRNQLDLFFKGKTGVVLLDHKCRNAFASFFQVGLRKHRVEIRETGVGNKSLHAVDDVLSAVASGGSLNRRHIGPGFGFGYRESGNRLARSYSRKKSALEIIRCRKRQRKAAKALHR